MTVILLRFHNIFFLYKFSVLIELKLICKVSFLNKALV